ncbi:ciliary basal body-associated, B9 protein-domain-containing protein [Polychytrium aggregatum]|uniref:ciliary basal body-associated, B9 protein-domain-containing protein n=1 Tax=Polychytrium aggregatum TaxID=110093 RepID=UPI0022FF1EC4|nr:ciliary basal body-associated, B9 protein-domain-containing protein [Polychytrium aggregatum]KAI9190773.1 ciliary basal body-associated, B9 protein-domain-containing protein [Polychytrium aggregatum]
MLGTRYYRTFDEIENVKVKVRLAIVKSTHNRGPLKQKGSKHSKGSHSKLPAVEQSISWQQKIYSPADLIHFQESGIVAQLYPNTPSVEQVLSKKHSRQAKVASHGIQEQDEPYIFTYVHQDEYAAGVATADLVIGPDGQSRKLRSPTDSHKPKDQSLFQEMFIVACLKLDIHNRETKVVHGKTVSEPVVVNHVLCKIQGFTNGLVEMTPGLTEGDTPYRFSFGANDYELFIKNDSQELTLADEDRERTFYQDFYSRRSSIRALAIGKEFSVVPEEFSSKLSVIGEIGSARGFPTDELFVEFAVEFDPTTWVLPEAIGLDHLTGRSSRSQCRWSKDDQEFQFVLGLPLEVHIFARKQNARPPIIFFQVGSIDSWDRYTFHGYGYLLLPDTPGTHMLNVPTWKPAPTQSSKMAEYFLGNWPEVQTTIYPDIPTHKTIPALNHCGTRICTSGSLSLRLNVAKQVHSARSGEGAVDDRFESEKSRAISDALMRAKARLESIRAEKTGMWQGSGQGLRHTNSQ